MPVNKQEKEIEWTSKKRKKKGGEKKERKKKKDTNGKGND